MNTNFYKTLKILRQKFLDSMLEFRELTDMLSTDSDSVVNHITQHILQSGGKRLRPLFSLIVGAIYKKEKEVRPLALGVELLHNATLLHDDVVDKGDMRRGRPTANNIWGNKRSLLVGDYLLSEVFDILARTNNVEVLKMMTHVTAKIARAEIMQLENDGDFDISYDRYIEIVNGKTASLFGAACEISAVFLELPESDRIAWRMFGVNFGLAFQILDDLSDYIASGIELGKDTMHDIFDNKVTLPAILLFQKSAECKKYIADNLCKNDDDKKMALIYFLREECKKYDIASEVTRYAVSYANKAEDNLRNITSSRIFDDEAMEVINLLLDLTRFLVKDD